MHGMYSRPFHHGFHGRGRRGMFFPPMMFAPLFLIGGILFVAFVVSALPWLPMLLIGFAIGRWVSFRHDHTGTDEDGKPKRDFVHDFARDFRSWRWEGSDWGREGVSWKRPSDTEYV